LEDARAAIEAGADWLGFIFVPETPRFLSLESAKSILTAIKQEVPHIRLIGVFKDMPVNEIQQHLAVLPLDKVQLHGNELVTDFSDLSVPIIKVLLLDPVASISELQMQAKQWVNQPSVETILLDLPKGSGLKSILEWPGCTELNQLTQEFPCVVAGGLNPDNVSEVIHALNPLGVDVASGVEQSPGKKNMHRMQAFCRAVKTVEPQTDNGESIPCNR
jgi:phosphoribosylanthranilate isomerase